MFSIARKVMTMWTHKLLCVFVLCSSSCTRPNRCFMINDLNLQKVSTFDLLIFYVYHVSGFISIDCGRPYNSSYSEKTTGLLYISDATFIDSGKSNSISSGYKDDYQQQLWYLRSFPDGIRNCYKIATSQMVLNI